MTEILQRSDFELHTKFIDHLDQGIEVKSFTFTYSTPMSKPFMASFDGTDYINCKQAEGGIVVTFVDPELGVGRLKVRREVKVAAANFPDQTLSIEQVDNLPFTIVQSYSESQPSTRDTVKIPDSNRLMHFEDTLRVAALLGRQIVTQEPETLDMSLKDEILLNNQYYINQNGERSQLYGHRISTKSTIANEQIYEIFYPMNMLYSIRGTMLYPNGRYYEVSMHHDYPMNCFIENGSLRLHNFSLPAEWNGRTIETDLYITYTKA